MMQTPSTTEDHTSQLPALQLLIQLGYSYLSPDEALVARQGKSSQVLLKEIVRSQLRKINTVRVSSSQSTQLSDTNIDTALRTLEHLNLSQGYLKASQHMHELLLNGTTLEQSVNGNKRDYTVHYIDWQNWQNNVFHVSEEMSVRRSNSHDDHYRPDIVLFVNGIPLAVIECKSAHIQAPIKEAISQHLRNQQADGIRALYVYAQLLLSLSVNNAKYGTNGTPHEFWAHWEEKFDSPKAANDHHTHLTRLKNTPLPPATQDSIFGHRTRVARQRFEALTSQPLALTAQDRYLQGLCRPERLLDFVAHFTLFDNGFKKVARYQQYFAIKKTMHQVSHLQAGKRLGGVVWHTQGSGKSLTMVMLAKALVLSPAIANPKIVLVTDRTDLDSQISRTFAHCGAKVQNAASGTALATLLADPDDAVITTVINKFETAVKKLKHPINSPNVFVLIDEGHRTQYGTFNIEMQKALPNACFIAFTGTPLFKKDKSTLAKFGRLIDSYTVDQAVKDKAVLPLIYEGRHAHQHVDEDTLDSFFSLVAEPLTPYERAELKKKFSRTDQLNAAEQKIKRVSIDIVHHFLSNFKNTGLKGQLVCQSKVVAIKYKKAIDDLGLVKTELVISPPDTREGHESAYGEPVAAVQAFWKKMMDQHSTAKKYQEDIVNRFSHTHEPDIIIVVDKLLTGFDAPRNTVLYLTRNLQGHTLLQAIARVNRVHPDKDYGYVIDYYGVLGALDDALETYSTLSDFDARDLQGTLTHIKEEIKKLAQKYSELWDIFKTIANKQDQEAYEQHLRDDALRVEFYQKLTAYARILKLALSSVDFHSSTPEATIQQYKKDLRFFMNLRRAVIQRYSDSVDYQKYAGQIQTLIDTHIGSDKVSPITGLVDIFDTDAFQQEVEQTIGEAAKADKIASRTAKYATEKMDEDPAFYKKFSEMLKDTIRDYEAQRINGAEYLEQIQQINQVMLAGKEDNTPEEFANKPASRAFYNHVTKALKAKVADEEALSKVATQVALAAERIIETHKVVDWQKKESIGKKMVMDIGDVLIDDVAPTHHFRLSFSEVDELAAHIVETAKQWY